MTVEKTLPKETLAALDLHEGDSFRGEVRDGQIVLSVTTSSPKDKTRSGKDFTAKWAGRFKEILDMDLSDDPRAEYILNR